MKYLNSLKVIIIIAGLIISYSSFGQSASIFSNPKYGPDSVARMQCASNLSIMNQYVKIKTYEYAYEAWNYCFNNCPEASKNIYIHGAKILKYQIENSADEITQNQYIDTLMLLYDQRLKYFRQPGYVYGLKGVDLIKYRKSALEEAYCYLEKSIDLREEKVDEAVAVTFITATYALMQDGIIGKDVMINNYVKIIDLLNEKLESGDDDPSTPQAVESIEKVFAESGAANCESLINIYTLRYESDKQNIDLLKKITSLLDKTGCQSSDLFASASESLYSVEPSSDAAAMLGKLFAIKEQYEKSIGYYNKAIELESDKIKKAGFFYDLARVNLQQKDYPAVRKNCLAAIDLKNVYGDAYILIGSAYALGSRGCGESDFERQAVYWAAVDKFIKAKSVDPSVAEKANEQINLYSQYFPNNEITFFNGYSDGQTYKVGCWIAETTVVRTIKQ